MKKLTIQDATTEAKSRGGKCLSNKYIDTRTPLLWECSKGHVWKQKLSRIRNGGNWCPECGGTKKKDKVFLQAKVATPCLQLRNHQGTIIKVASLMTFQK